MTTLHRTLRLLLLAPSGCALVGGIDADELSPLGEGGGAQPSASATSTSTSTSSSSGSTTSGGGSSADGGGGTATTGSSSGGGGSGGSGGSGASSSSGGGGGAGPASCEDGATNGQETDVDCGGPACEACADGRGCAIAADCESDVCEGDVCQAPRCDDGVKNGDEDLAVDCGGGCPCAPGQPCELGGDCGSGVCLGGTCQAPSCNDGVQNGTESDADCGGSCPDRCGVGDACGEGGDCGSGVCVADICRAPTCTDGVTNGGETDVDCGGATACGRCAEGEGCGDGGDCASSVCSAGACAPPGCGDGAQNGGETDVDCGGPCGASCEVDEACAGPGDCVEGVCEGGACAAPTCLDGVANGGETGVDCGGPCGATCAPGEPCDGPGDCAEGVCDAGTCATPRCDDGVENGAESDLDCGGADCAGCDNGLGCAVDGDCASGRCATGACGPWSLRSSSDSHESGRPHCAAWTPSGELVVAGHSASGSLDFGGGAASGAGDWDGFWVRSTRDGAPGPVRRVGGAAREILGPIAAAPDGRIVVAGWYSGQPTLGGHPMPAASGLDAVVLLVGADDQVIWARALGGAGDDKVHAVAFTPDGDVIVGGELGGTDSNYQWFGSAFVERLDGATGDTVWSSTFGGTAQGDLVRGVDVDASGGVLVVGSYGDAAGGTLDLGAGVTLGASVSRDGFVARLDAGAGSALWARRAEGILQADLHDVVALPGGDLVVGGTSRGTTSLAGGASVQGPGEYDVFLGRLDGNGAHVWSFARGGISTEEAYDLAVAPDGSIVATGYTSSATYSLGGPVLSGGGAGDPWVGRFDPATGAHLASTGFGGASDAVACGVAFGPDGTLGIAGHASAALDLGDGPKADPGPGYGFFLGSLGRAP